MNESDASFILRTCSYNIHKGFNSVNSQFLLDKIRHAIRLLDADLVFLQEVVGKNSHHARSVPNWISESQFEFLADTLWPHYAYGKNAVYDNGHHGNAILSRYPLSGWSNTSLSLLPFSHRGLLHTKILGQLHLFCVHCGLFAFERKAQLKKLVKTIQQQVDDNEPFIIAGDFNDWRNAAGPLLWHELGAEDVLSVIHGKPQATFPAFFPLLAMDRIYFRGLELVDGEVLTGSPWHGLSDHCAIYAGLAFTSHPVQTDF